MIWTTRYFKSYSEQARWIKNNGYRFQITPLFVANGYAVEWRKLVKPGMAR